jgi:hypothetical protein
MKQVFQTHLVEAVWQDASEGLDSKLSLRLLLLHTTSIC